MIDMHVHSKWGDGSFTPKELAEMAKEKGLKGVCLTDHDTYLGTEEMIQKCDKLGLLTVSGIEVSANHMGDYIHLLIYQIERLIEDQRFNNLLVQSCHIHHQRAVKLLDQYFVNGTLEEMISLNTVAKELGYCDSYVHFLKIFKYISELLGISYYEAKQGMIKPGVSPEDFPAAIDIIILAKENNAKVFLAHPMTIKRFKKFQDFDHIWTLLGMFISDLEKVGLCGVEEYHTKHNDPQELFLHEFAHQRDLLISGGSDFHGELSPKVEIGDRGISQKDFDKIIEKVRN